MVGEKGRGSQGDQRLRLALAAALVVVVLAVGVSTRLQEEPYVGWETETAYAPQVGEPNYDDVWLLARMVASEARGEPYEGQVAVAAVIVNRVRNPRFPNTVAGVLFEPWAFEPVLNGTFWTAPVTEEHVRAAEQALNGWDPSYGSLFFWNPGTATSPWIWTRRIITQIGEHVFGL
ncbi:MAG TPA: spore cortex-lytic protein [Firmicutes bacterium]|nr:spore cortex-lytic protein [Bacillota bacterium]